MAAELKPRLTFDEYLEIEGEAEFKSEFVNGWMYAMAGASPEHNLIVVNVASEFRQQLKKRPCVVYPSDMPLKVEKREHGRYPDVTVVFGVVGSLRQSGTTRGGMIPTLPYCAKLAKGI